MKGRRKSGGFSLIELMVTVVLAFVIVGAVYMLYAQSVAAYRVENQVVDMQARLRFGLEHLKRDFRRAGFLATPNSLVDGNVCPKPAAHLRALTVMVNQGTVYQPWPNANPNVWPSSVVLFGDFFSGRSYKTLTIQDDKVYLYVPEPPAVEGMSDPYPRTEVEFNRIFDPYPGVRTRYLRIVTADQFELFFPIESADFDEASVTLEQAPPRAGPGNACGITSFGEGLDVNVAGFVRYRVLADSRTNAPVGKTDLVREELQVNGADVVGGSQLVIADYAVDLQFYDFGLDTDPSGTSPTIVMYQFVNQVADEWGGGLLGANAGAAPENLRMLTVKLTMRSESEDPAFMLEPRQGLFEPLTGFELADMEGACRTFTLASRVELTSLAVRNLKPVPGGGP